MKGLWMIGVFGFNVLYGQVQTGAILLESAGSAHSSIMGYSAYPAQKIEGGGVVGVFGTRYFQMGLQGVGLLGAMKIGRHSLVAGGERMSNGALNGGRFSVGYAVPLLKGTFLGVKAGLQNWTAKGYLPYRKPGVGIGWSTDISDKLQWKVQADGVERFWEKDEFSRFLVRSALYYMVTEQVGLTVDALLEEGQLAVFTPALHYAFEERFFIRVGAISNFNSIGTVVGFKQDGWNVELSILLHNKLGYSGFISAYYKF